MNYKMNITNLNTLKKLKHSLMKIILVVFLLFSVQVFTQAQGIYRPNTNEKKTDNTENAKPVEGAGLFRAGDDGDGGDHPDQPGGIDDPVGEGILILSLLSGTYAFVKRNIKRKHEN